MWELDYKESWVPKNGCFRTVVWRRVLRVPWTARRADQSILKEINPEYSLEGLILKRKLQYFGHLIQTTDSLEKTLNAGKSWRREEKGLTEDKMVGWHHRFNGLEFEQALGDAEGQGSLVCCSPWGHKEFDTTEQPNSNKQCLEKGIFNLLYWRIANLQYILLYSKVIHLYICIRLFLIWVHVVLVAHGFLSLVAACQLNSCVVGPWLSYSLWDLSFLSRDRTRTPCIDWWILNHWTTREVPAFFFVFFSITVYHRIEKFCDSIL